MSKRLLGAKEIALMTRLFGPEVPSGLDEIFQAAKGVSWKAPADARTAVDALINSILHTGIGDGPIGGWTVRKDGEWVRLDVCRIVVPKALAA